jgi:ribonuclease G
MENTRKFEEMFDMDFDLISASRSESSQKDINQILQIDQPVLVQVVKEPIGTKGARLTSNLSIAGRYLVLLPNTPHRGVSRKIEDKHSRDRLKTLIKSFEMPQDMGLICRTASIHATTEHLVQEARDLLKTWESIVEKFHGSKDPTCLFEESDLIKRAIITAVDKKYDRVIVDDHDVFLRCQKLYEQYKDQHPVKIEFYQDKLPLFEKYNLEKEIDKSLRRKIWLQSGGYLYFDKTEAMHTIDVNSGRSTTGELRGNVEESLVRINLEAAEEIARQFRIRNIGGLVICDFIDMKSRKNQKRVLESLKEHMKEDSAKCTLLGMSEFGLVEMTRQRHRESLSQTLLINCPYCVGRGLIKSHETLSIELERALKKLFRMNNQKQIQLTIHPEVYRYLEQEGDKEFFQNLAQKVHGFITWKTKDTLHLNEFQFTTNTGQKIDV